MPPELIVAIDVGTSAIKGAVLDRSLQVVASAKAPLKVQYAAPLWAEQDPLDWWAAIRLVIAELGLQVPDLSARAAAIGFAAQTCAVVPVDENGTALAPCMIWLDKRSAPIIRKVMGGFPKIAGYGAARLLSSIWQTNGAPSLNGMDPPGKMVWLRQNRPDIWAKTHKLLDVRDWILHRCTGRFATTADSANLTWMADTRKGHAVWSDRLMAMFGVPAHMLPEIIDGGDIVAGLDARASAETGLPKGLPVLAGCSDICAATLGSGATANGALHICLGTSAWIAGFFDGRRLNTNDAYATIISPVSNAHLLIASQENAGSCLDWYSRMAAEGGGADANPPLFLPWLAGERVPVDDNRLAGAFLGLTLDHNASSLRQAVAEGIALNLNWAMQSVIKQKGVKRADLLPVVGGAALDARLIQALADCLGQDLWRPDTPQLAGVRGVGALVAQGLGWIGNARDAFASPHKEEGTVIKHNPDRAAYFAQRMDMFTDAYKSLRRWYHKHGREAVQQSPKQGESR